MIQVKVRGRVYELDPASILEHHHDAYIFDRHVYYVMQGAPMPANLVFAYKFGQSTDYKAIPTRRPANLTTKKKVI